MLSPGRAPGHSRETKGLGRLQRGVKASADAVMARWAEGGDEKAPAEDTGREKGRKREQDKAVCSGGGSALFLGPRAPRYHLLAATQGLARRREGGQNARGGSERTGPRPGGREKVGSRPELMLPPRAHRAGSEGGGRDKSDRKLRNKGATPDSGGGGGRGRWVRERGGGQRGQLGMGTREARDG